MPVSGTRFPLYDPCLTFEIDGSDSADDSGIEETFSLTERNVLELTLPPTTTKETRPTDPLNDYVANTPLELTAAEANIFSCTNAPLELTTAETNISFRSKRAGSADRVPAALCSSRVSAHEGAVRAAPATNLDDTINADNEMDANFTAGIKLKQPPTHHHQPPNHSPHPLANGGSCGSRADGGAAPTLVPHCAVINQTTPRNGDMHDVFVAH